MLEEKRVYLHTAISQIGLCQGKKTNQKNQRKGREKRLLDATPISRRGQGHTTLLKKPQKKVTPANDQRWPSENMDSKTTETEERTKSKTLVILFTSIASNLCVRLIVCCVEIFRYPSAIFQHIRPICFGEISKDLDS